MKEVLQYERGGGDSNQRFQRTAIALRARPAAEPQRWAHVPPEWKGGMPRLEQQSSLAK
jgi:hypothetical protein